MSTVPGDVRLAYHVADIDDDGHHTGSSGTGLPWFDVTDPTYGAVGDGSTDDRTAINAAIAALNSAGAGVLYFPATADYYYASNALTALTVPCLVLGDGAGSSTGAASVIATDHATANLFTVSNDGITIRALKLINYGGTETAGAAIATTTGYGSHCHYEDLWVEGFRDGLDLLYGAEWTMTGCHVTNPVRYGLSIANIDIPDGGDWAITDCWFGTRSRNATAAIFQASAGGGKVTNVKVNCNSLADASAFGGVKRYTTGYDVAITSSTNSTSILLMSNVSIENITTDAIRVTTTSTGSFGHVIVHGCQFGLYTNNSGRAVKLTAATNGALGVNGSVAMCIIDSCSASTDGTARAAIELTNTDHVTLGQIELKTFNARYTSSGDTNTTDGTSITYATPAIVLGTAAAAGAASSVIRSDSTIVAFDATAPTTIAYSDAAAAGSAAVAARRDHRHGAPAAGSGIGEILIVDSPSTPLIFADLVQNDDQTDLLYADP